MIWEQNVPAILMLNNLIECGMVKCHEYWPNADGAAEAFFDVNIEVKNMETIKESHYVLRKFRVTDLNVSLLVC